MECDKIKNLISDYSAGLLDGRQKVEVDQHLAACQSCAAELEKLYGVLNLVEDLDVMEPPAGLWNGVYNKINQPQKKRAWGNVFHRRAVGWSVGFAVAVLAAVMLLTQIYGPSKDVYAANEYMQGHMVYASQEYLADRAALNSVAAMAYREQVGGNER